MVKVRAKYKGTEMFLPVPSEFNVINNTEFDLEKTSDGTLVFKPTGKGPKTAEELFEGWHGKYEIPEDLKGWIL